MPDAYASATGSTSPSPRISTSLRTARLGARNVSDPPASAASARMASSTPIPDASMNVTADRSTVRCTGPGPSPAARASRMASQVQMSISPETVTVAAGGVRVPVMRAGLSRAGMPLQGARSGPSWTIMLNPVPDGKPAMTGSGIVQVGDVFRECETRDQIVQEAGP